MRTQILPNGSKFSYGHDESGAVTAITQSTEEGEENSTQILYTCGEVTELRSGNNVVNYAYDYKRRKTAVDLNGTKDYVKYSYADNVTEDGKKVNKVTATYVERTLTDGTKVNDSFTTVSDLYGKTLETKYGDATLIKVTYDEKDRGTKITDNVCSTETSLTYDNLDRVIKVESDNVIETSEFNTDGNLATKTVTVSGKETKYAYGYKTNAAKELEYVEIDDSIKVYPQTDCLGRNTDKEITLGDNKLTEEHITYRKVGDHATNMPSTMRFGNHVVIPSVAEESKTQFVRLDNLKYTYDSCGNISEIWENGKLSAVFLYLIFDRKSVIIKSMKIKKRILTLITVVAVFACGLFSACGANEKPQSHVQRLNYEESTQTIDNPDRGFYRPVYVRVTEEGVSCNRSIVNDATRLYHLRIDISAFSAAVNGNADKPLTQEALSGLRDLLGFLKEEDKNAIVRFAYDPSYGGAKDKEPALQTILQHVEQVCPVLNAYVSTVTAIEVGLIGPWGEMHSSAIANAQNISPIIGKFLDSTANIPVLARTPKMIYDYLGITAADAENHTIDATEKAYFLGLYNDGYLGSSSDLGTYTDRERDIEFLSKQTEHLPYGGEVVIPDSTLHNIDVCLPEMNKINLSYLNVEWNNIVIDKWKNSYYTSDCGTDEAYYGKTAFDYIQNHMGYRFVLKNSTFSYYDKLDELNVELTLQNVGFGNLNKKKNARLIITDESGSVAFTQSVGTYSGEANASYSAKLNLGYGNYDVYLRLYGEEVEETPLYCVQFANDGLWNPALKANKIGSIEYSER